MVECQICMESFPADVFQFLPCAHSLCNFCFTNIKKPECPFCKHSFSEEIPEEREEEIFEDPDIVELPVSKRQKKRNRNKRKKKLFEFISNSSSGVSVSSTTNFHVLGNETG